MNNQKQNLINMVNDLFNQNNQNNKGNKTQGILYNQNKLNDVMNRKINPKDQVRTNKRSINDNLS